MFKIMFFDYLILINIITFLVFMIDKILAKSKKKKKTRISEDSLIFLSAIGGSIGAHLSMIIFRHKTQKIKFKLGVPVILILTLTLIYFVYK